MNKRGNRQHTSDEENFKLSAVKELEEGKGGEKDSFSQDAEEGPGGPSGGP